MTSSSVVIIDYLNVVRGTVDPSETDAPLLVDSYTVFTLPRSRQPFQAIASSDPQFQQRGGIIQNLETPPRLVCKSLKSLNRFPITQSFSIPIPEAAYH
jgi:hypothetical protein